MDEKDKINNWVASFNKTPTSDLESVYGGIPNKFKEITRPKYSCFMCPEIYTEMYAEATNFRCFCADVYSFEEWCELNPTLTSGEYLNSQDIKNLEQDYERYVREFYFAELSPIPQVRMYPKSRFMWSFTESSDIKWLESHLDIMSNLGFRIYEVFGKGQFFGVDDGEDSMYENYWNPLYQARMFRWKLGEED